MDNKIEITLTENEYAELLQQSVAVLERAKTNIARSIASNLNNSHWEIGRLLHERKLDSKYGSGVVLRLSGDLKQKFPTLGVSPRQLWNMKMFYLRFYQSDTKLIQAVSVLPWGHMIYLMQKFPDDNSAIAYYAMETNEKGWSREILVNAVKLKMHENADNRLLDSNFSLVLPAAQAEYANTVFHDTVNLGILGVTEPLLERELEARIVDKVKRFLLELGKGFTFIGDQYPIEYNGRGGVLDLLLFHRGMRSLVALELKAGPFLPEYAGKMNYYLSILDRTERGEDENPSIGIILCAEKDSVDVELALDGLNKPIGVADYKLIIPQEKLKEIVQNEIAAYNQDKLSEGEDAIDS